MRSLTSALEPPGKHDTHVLFPRAAVWGTGDRNARAHDGDDLARKSFSATPEKLQKASRVSEGLRRFSMEKANANIALAFSRSRRQVQKNA
jgi:hypothetical protein